MVQEGNPSCPVLLVDDEVEALEGNEARLRINGINNIIICSDSRKVMDVLAQQKVSAILLDLMMPHVSGEELLEMIPQQHPGVPIIVLTAANDVPVAVQCMKAGAFDYMVKPVEETRMISGIQRAIQFYELRNDYNTLRQRMLSPVLEHPEAFTEIVTDDPKLLSVMSYAETIAPTSRPVLITGETGVGKELVARAIHTLSRQKESFVAVNVAGLDDTVFSDTLFGHVKGAFTGADQDRAGLIEQAKGGTLFLDEIGDLSVASQVKLLRLIQEREYFAVGADLPKHTDARLVVATNRDLPELQKQGKFRRDLYYRLCDHYLHVPALRERPHDIPVLLDYFLEEAADELGKRKPTYPKELPGLLASCQFPGNIREMRSIVFEAVSRHTSRMLSMDVFKERTKGAMVSDEQRPVPHADMSQYLPGSSDFPTMEEMTNFLVSEAMEKAKGNQTVAAKLLNVSRTTLNKRLKRSSEEE